jgi:hypothetical protein
MQLTGVAAPRKRAAAFDLLEDAASADRRYDERILFDKMTGAKQRSGCGQCRLTKRD